ncbi:hypothetical protein METBIDRAFT_30316 [Metschnikowia bicuspidata var. bicuspidata NRRL YB-4993]|uniref:Membrane magnesium transporter n=1 Tax=Metschnikowia bicuspidata var. bicuspidata NRRL YB-4993 TaxID=869754 RepID=A0A1A0HJE2_9ASCO|nr:hypothetical protein METBIDRAFT_30316 [Metschnikowia bicuspidata var. bicuspidata NRRL YB-4993]OBA23958.1 hypothetical protein METBIDRAFT_30316 [Metschnikowia bicuspidata var. bicuspidata NRRL YB-4993]
MLSILGFMLLLHAAYSSYEHHQLLKGVTVIPRDIIYEMLLGLVLLNFGTIQSLKNSDRLAVISAQIISPPNKYLGPISISEAVLTNNSLEISAYEILESRVELMDIRRSREDYLNWVRFQK